jgi:hypothetical protein
MKIQSVGIPGSNHPVAQFLASVAHQWWYAQQAEEEWYIIEKNT